MPSKVRDTRENQIKLYDQSIKKRRDDLEKKGLAPKDFNKDNVFKHLKAKRRAILNAIAVIDARNARNERHVEEAPAPAAPKEKKPKKKAAPTKDGK